MYIYQIGTTNLIGFYKFDKKISWENKEKMVRDYIYDFERKNIKYKATKVSMSAVLYTDKNRTAYEKLLEFNKYGGYGGVDVFGFQPVKAKSLWYHTTGIITEMSNLIDFEEEVVPLDLIELELELTINPLWVPINPYIWFPVYHRDYDIRSFYTDNVTPEQNSFEDFLVVKSGSTFIGKCITCPDVETENDEGIILTKQDLYINYASVPENEIKIDEEVGFVFYKANSDIVGIDTREEYANPDSYFSVSNQHIVIEKQSCTEELPQIELEVARNENGPVLYELYFSGFSENQTYAEIEIDNYLGSGVSKKKIVVDFGILDKQDIYRTDTIAQSLAKSDIMVLMSFRNKNIFSVIHRTTHEKVYSIQTGNDVQINFDSNTEMCYLNNDLTKIRIKFMMYQPEETTPVLDISTAVSGVFYKVSL